MYLFVPCDKKSHGTEISVPIRSNRLSHPHPLRSTTSIPQCNEDQNQEDNYRKHS